MADELKQLIGSRTPVHILRNPVDIESIRETAARQLVPWSGLGPHLLAIGRLSHEKGFDLLLDAFAAVRKEYPGANLTILGEGAERSSLRSKGDGLGLTASVRLAGYVREPAAWFAGATLLVIPSRCEALPNALLEGAAAGLPIVATPCSSGMEDLIDGRAGIWLARDISSEALARSLKAALVTLRPGERFEHSWLAPFDLPNAVAGYRNLILETLTGVSG
jgi:glycosyltransferase involved in cell wall biosynthesis